MTFCENNNETVGGGFNMRKFLEQVRESFLCRQVSSNSTGRVTSSELGR